MSHVKTFFADLRRFTIGDAGVLTALTLDVTSGKLCNAVVTLHLAVKHLPHNLSGCTWLNRCQGCFHFDVARQLPLLEHVGIISLNTLELISFLIKVH